MWSFNRDGEVDAALKKLLNMAMGIDENAKRSDRRDLLGEARPQRWVATFRSAFPDAGAAPEGVRDVDDDG